ncbi:MAG TPA: AAA family ATPase [Ignavibacteriales bacterium]|nr:AAA family ATPase [Ignavibacteriales bacterium]HOL81136.1 AAA family ATPase [Ignavibacteriales bacterium]HOM65239.1 AAA family ATPase [Ignavibacteriales bacterium]HPP33508.1 AAA family ATPase [Ignavibacteriales bacterium]HRT99612.1 AAA family ATPase [Ignavibacteriales bacterium]
MKNFRYIKKEIDKSKIISRDDYINSILEFINDEKAILIKGNPFTGKTFLLYQTAEKIYKSGFDEENILYVDLKSLNANHLLTMNNFVNYLKQNLDSNIKGKIFLLIDNIGTLNFDANNFIKHFDTNKIKFIFTSDVIPLSIENCHYIELYPFTIKDVSKDKMKFNLLIERGGLPIYFFDCIKINSFELVDIIKNRIIINLIRKYQIKDVFLLNVIIEIISQNIGNYTTIKRIKDILLENGYNVNFETVQDYVDFLIAENYVYKIEKINFRNLQKVQNYIKLYPYDYLFSIRYGLSLEALLEHLAVVYFKSQNYELFYGGYKDSTIPLIAKKGNELEYYQFIDSLDNHQALSEKINNFKKIKDFYPKNFITMNTSKIDNIMGIKNILPYNIKIFE